MVILFYIEGYLDVCLGGDCCCVHGIILWCTQGYLVLCPGCHFCVPGVLLLFIQSDLVAAGVLSGNRNFEGRINPLTRANYLASPPLVIAYALAGTVLIDFDSEPLGQSVCHLSLIHI